MAKKIKKKRKIRLLPFLIVMMVGVLGYFSTVFILNMKIENIIIVGNNRVDDQTIIEMAGISDYPSFYLTKSSSMKRKLLANPYIKDVKIKKEFYHVLKIEVEEYKILYQRFTDRKIILENGKELLSEDKIYGIPVVLNYIPDDKIDSFLDGMNRMKPEILKQISEITYTPNDYDKDRFLLTMNDGNSVYLTLTKFDMINYYDEVLPQLEGKKGILYLDSGNHFQIMES